jgi:hypothetical protein
MVSERLQQPLLPHCHVRWVRTQEQVRMRILIKAFGGVDETCIELQQL